MTKNRRNRRKNRDRSCFEFLKQGKCAYGDNCKFLHEIVAPEEVSETKLDGNSNPGLEKLQVATACFPIELIDNFPCIKKKRKLMSYSFLIEYDLRNTIFNEGTEFPIEETETWLKIRRPRAYELRYFNQMFFEIRKVENNNISIEDLYINLHSNGIGTLHLSPFHDCFKKQSPNMTHMDFFVKDPSLNHGSVERNDSVSDTQKLKPNVKKKIIYLKEEERICNVYCDESHRTYTVKNPFRGILLEVNMNLVNNISNLNKKHGYLVILKFDKVLLQSLSTVSYDKNTYLQRLNNFLVDSKQVH